MNFYVGVTDNDWYTFLKERQPDEVNFWRPGGQTFSVLEMGQPFLFKLHSPQNYIVGGGFFVRYTKLPVSMAWKVFEEKNGVGSYPTFSDKIFSYLSLDRRKVPDPEIGCIVLSVPFFFDEDDWIPAPKDWSANIVSGKGYTTESAIGKELWDNVQLLLTKKAVGREPIKKSAIADDQPAYGSEYLVRARLGQGGFRTLVIDAYQRRCAISAERTLPVLEAAHIKRYAESGPHSVNNGLLLRADLHILFDEGFLTLTTDHRVEVSKRIKEEYENGRDYYAFHGKGLVNLPKDPADLPERSFLEWHNRNVFLG